MNLGFFQKSTLRNDLSHLASGIISSYYTSIIDDFHSHLDVAWNGNDPRLVLQPGFRSASGALAPVTFTGALLMAPAPHRPVLDRLNRRRVLPDQMPKQPPHL